MQVFPLASLYQVMMQVFAAVNTFLAEADGGAAPPRHGPSGGMAAESRSSGGTAASVKRIKTYTVVPLSPEVGVMEWVQHTIPIGNFLVDKARSKPGAHAR